MAARSTEASYGGPAMPGPLARKATIMSLLLIATALSAALALIAVIHGAHGYAES